MLQVSNLSKSFVIDILTHTVNECPGNYSDYMATKEREREKQWAAYKDQQDWIAQL